MSLWGEQVSIQKVKFKQLALYHKKTFPIPADGSTYKAVLTALKSGICMIDTAVAYFNEEEVGKAIKDSGIPREEIFVTSSSF